MLNRQPWALGLLESRNAPGPAALRHHDAVVGVLRRAGFPVALAAHAYALLDSFVYGFALQEASLPAAQPDGIAERTDSIMRDFADGAYPHLTEMATEHILEPGYTFGDSFDFGLTLILDALAQRLRQPADPAAAQPDSRQIRHPAGAVSRSVDPAQPPGGAAVQPPPREIGRRAPSPGADTVMEGPKRRKGPR